MDSHLVYILPSLVDITKQPASSHDALRGSHYMFVGRINRWCVNAFIKSVHFSRNELQPVVVGWLCYFSYNEWLKKYLESKLLHPLFTDHFSNISKTEKPGSWITFICTLHKPNCLWSQYLTITWLIWPIRRRVPRSILKCKWAHLDSPSWPN